MKLLLITLGIVVGWSSFQNQGPEDLFEAQWILSDGSLELWSSTIPCRYSSSSSDYLYIGSDRGRCYTPRPLELTEFSVFILESLVAAESCEWRLTGGAYPFGVIQGWSNVFAGPSQAPSCDEDTLDDADLDTAGESCTNYGSVILAPGDLWFVFRSNFAACTAFASAQFTVRGRYLD